MATQKETPFNGQAANSLDNIPLPGLGFELAVQKLEGGDQKDRADAMSILHEMIAGKTRDGYRVAENDQRDALVYAGWIYLEGRYGVEVKEKKAFRFARKAARQFKDPFAYALLGECYYRGAGTVKDIDRACRTWRKGWRKSNNGACAYHLARYYYDMGITKEAIKFAESALASGMPEAIPLLKRLQGEPTTPPTERKET